MNYITAAINIYISLVKNPAAETAGCINYLIEVEKPMKIGKKLFTTRQIQSKVKELAQRISSDYEGKEIFAVGILKAAVIFFADLIRAITVPLTFDFIIASSYKKMETTGYVNIYSDLR